MYEMTLNGETFFCPANERYTLTESILNEALNDSGYIEATVPSSNPLYEVVEALKSKVELTKDGEPVFNGLITEVDIDFQKQKHIYIVGELSYLANTIQLQQDRSGLTRSGLLTVLLQFHNQQSDEKFYAGRVAVSGDVGTALIDYGYTLDIIKDYVCKDDGYIKIVRRNGRREIDILPIEGYGKRSDQYIRFASNLLDYSQNYGGDSVATAIIPLGKKVEQSTVEGLDGRLTVESVNGGSKILVNQAGVSAFGYRCKVVEFDTDDVETLLRLAKAYLTNYQYASLTLEITAVDLSQIDSSQDDYDVGDYVRCTAEPFEMDSWFPVRSKQTNILDLSQNKISIGATRSSSLTQSTSASLTTITEKLPQNNTILEQAKNNATQLIVDATTGFVTVRNNEITIANAQNNPSQIWRWNMGGLGYSKDGGQTYGTAITMDGSIVADFINAGTMVADRIRGGKLEVGGTGAGVDGSIYGYTSNGSEIFRLDKNGAVFRGDISAATLSGGAGNTLQNAIDTANSAIERANDAISRVNDLADRANSTANTAQSTASSAQSTANTAQGTASNAQSTANRVSDRVESVFAGRASVNEMRIGTLYLNDGGNMRRVQRMSDGTLKSL